MGRAAIIVTGFPGSGSTTLARKLAEIYQWPFYYSGAVVAHLMAQISEKGAAAVLKNITLEGLIQIFEEGSCLGKPRSPARYADFPPELDILVDNAQVAILCAKPNGVHEGRIVWHLAKKFKDKEGLENKKIKSLCLTVDEEVGAERQLKRPENSFRTKVEMIEETRGRLAAEKEKYSLLYGIKNHLAPENFDAVIDTTSLTEAQTLQKAIGFLLTPPVVC